MLHPAAGGADRDLFTQRGGARHRADRLPDHRGEFSVGSILAHRSELHMARLSRRGDGRGGARLHHVPQTAESVEISRMEKSHGVRGAAAPPLVAG